MNSNIQDFDINALAAELEKLFRDKIDSHLLSESQLYKELSDQFKEKIDEHQKKFSEVKNKDSLQALLFEYASFSDSIFSLLEETIKEKHSSDFYEMIETMLDQAYQMMEVIPENESVVEQIKKVNSEFIRKDNSLILFRNKLTRKQKKSTSDLPKTDNIEPDLKHYKDYPNRNFFFYFLVILNLKNQLNWYETFLANVVILLNYLRSVSDTQINLFEQFAARNYNIETIDEFEILDLNLSELEKLLLNVDSSGKEIVNGLSFQLSKLIEDYSQERKIESEGYNKRVNIKKECERIANSINKIRENWFNSIFLLSEDWKLDLEIHAFRLYILKEYFDFSKVIHSKFTDPVEETITLMKISLHELNANIEATKKTQTDFEKTFTKLKIDFKRKFVLKLIPALKETIHKSDIPKSIDEIESGLTKRFSDISPKRYVIKNPDYNRPIDKVEFESISPSELVGYEFMPKLKAVFPDLKTSFINHVQSFEKRITEIPEIVNFNIETSISYFKKEQNFGEALKIGAEGIERAENNLEELSTLMHSFIMQEVETLKVSIEQFITEISSIASNESALQIKVRVARLKAIERSKAIRTRIFNHIKNFLPKGLEYTRRAFNFLRQSSVKISKQFSVEEKAHFITSDTSDFLSATEKAINQLPYIYQKLFQNEPLSTFELYVGRAKPMDELTNAYKKWKEGKFAPVVIIGEKGSGKTTILNRFLKTKIQNEKVIFLNLHEVNKSPEEIYHEIESLVILKPGSKDQVEKERSTILAIDGLARLFSAEINGFTYLLKTMKLITETHSRIFWVISSHLYSWNYIDKSFNISDYFGYHIKLTELTAEDLKQIIEKRHSISGYRLIYEQPSIKKNIVSLKKMKPEDSQKEIEDAYFKSLTEFNKNNLSQAFLYWLRSTSKVEKDIIYIRQINKMNSNFVKSISQSKLIILRNILIHNGVTCESHSKIFGEDIEMGKLHLDQMLDDGLLIKDQDFYIVNPLIYSQIVNELYLQNLLH